MCPLLLARLLETKTATQNTEESSQHNPKFVLVLPPNSQDFSCLHWQRQQVWEPHSPQTALLSKQMAQPTCEDKHAYESSTSPVSIVIRLLKPFRVSSIVATYRNGVSSFWEG
ncbi:hypothetical protein NPIL_14371 [Nephila pilipes]|uniref:Uncharacterized protein n=1 Tax=Nephila pilipes TaxID=299642 RepID=A0A8X6UP64_NEPPI|nr:hypothetical protein NPIL_14371 [Nephila pilipes]